MLVRALFVWALATSGACSAAAMTPSCGLVDPVQLFRDAQASSDRFLILLGRLGLEDDLQEMGTELGPFPAPFDGLQLTPEGFTAPFSATIEVTRDCDETMLGICGWLRQGEETLLFARQTEDGSLRLTVGACGRWAQQNVTPEKVGELTACARGDCPTAP